MSLHASVRNVLWDTASTKPTPKVVYSIRVSLYVVSKRSCVVGKVVGIIAYFYENIFIFNIFRSEETLLKYFCFRNANMQRVSSVHE
jgi:hypothetical protein